jgi:hypothetical protein
MLLPPPPLLSARLSLRDSLARLSFMLASNPCDLPFANCLLLLDSDFVLLANDARLDANACDFLVTDPFLLLASDAQLEATFTLSSGSASGFASGLASY